MHAGAGGCMYTPLLLAPKCANAAPMTVIVTRTMRRCSSAPRFYVNALIVARVCKQTPQRWVSGSRALSHRLPVLSNFQYAVMRQNLRGYDETIGTLGSSNADCFPGWLAHNGGNL